MRSMRVCALPIFLLLAFGGGALALDGCDRDHRRDCSNETCFCPNGLSCELSCSAPPCNVACGEESSCEAACANGTCSCERGASCAFQCGAPPCHVRCAGGHERCDGTCANGTCACGVDSACVFECESGPCHSECPSGASCVVLCPNATAGTQDCDIISCWAGAPVLCPGGHATTCNAPCPDADAGVQCNPAARWLCARAARTPLSQQSLRQ